MTIIGPSLGAVLVVTVGSGWAVAVDALTWLVAAWCMGRLHLPSHDRLEATSMLHDLRAGWTEFASRTWVWVVVLAFAFLNAIQAGVWSTLGPVVVKDTVGVGVWGGVLSAEAVGFLVMTIVLLRIRLHRPLRAGMLGISALGLPMLVLGLSPQVLPLVVLAFIGGAGVEIFSIGWETSTQQHVPVHVLSRVSAYDGLGSVVAVPVGQITAGPLAELLGSREVVTGGGVAFSLLAFATLAVPSVRNLRRLPDTEPAPAA